MKARLERYEIEGNEEDVDKRERWDYASVFEKAGSDVLHFIQKSKTFLRWIPMCWHQSHHSIAFNSTLINLSLQAGILTVLLLRRFYMAPSLAGLCSASINPEVRRLIWSCVEDCPDKPTWVKAWRNVFPVSKQLVFIGQRRRLSKDVKNLASSLHKSQSPALIAFIRSRTVSCTAWARSWTKMIHLTAVFQMFQGMKHQEISSCAFQHPPLHALLKELFRPSGVLEQVAP